LPNKITYEVRRCCSGTFATALFMSWGIANNIEIANEALIYAYFTNAEPSFCLAPDSAEGGKVTGLDHLPGGFCLKALFGDSHCLSALHHLDVHFASFIPVSIIRQAWIYQKC